MKIVKVKKINKLKKLQNKYDLMIKKNHNFFANGILVHNSSATYIFQHQTMGKAFRVCSRNLELAEDENNIYWKVAKQYDLKNKLEKLNLDLAIQGEIFGEGLQKNPLKIKGHQFNVFLIKDLLRGTWLDWEETENICKVLGLATVPVLAIYTWKTLPSFTELQEIANKLVYPLGGHSEGMVLRTKKPVPSFALEKDWWSVKIMNEPYDTKK